MLMIDIILTDLLDPQVDKDQHLHQDLAFQDPMLSEEAICYSFEK